MPDLRPGPYSVVLKLAARVRARGPGELARLALGRARSAIASEGALVVLARPTAPRGDRAPAPPGCRFREATAGDGPRYARDVGTDSPASFRRRLTQATRCFVVERAGTLQHATWMTRRAAWTREVGGYFRPPAGDAYVYESYTRPEARGEGLYPFALDEIAAWLAARRVGRMWVAVEAGNLPSLRAVAKAGFEPACEVSFRRRAGRLTVPPAAGGPECAGLIAPTPGKNPETAGARDRSKR